MPTLGSLFDGIGGFPLAGMMCGIAPVWASEVEKYPMAVTAARLPAMRQLGDVTKIDGAEIEPVDIITFGSPCQDLSVAGKQLGIRDGQRSNLFFDAIRIIKEMREADEKRGRTGKHIRPRFAVWENVPGAFSSNKGEDFRAVLEAFASVRENDVDLPRPKKWDTGGGIVGHGWSVAWRVYDAQYWGVPQRRKRIYLVADFGSERAPEILFERESVRGDFAQSGTAGEGTAADAERGAGGSGEPVCLNFQGSKGSCLATDDGTAYSLMAMHGHDVHVVANSVKCLNPWDAQSKRLFEVDGKFHTIPAYSGGGGRADGICYSSSEKFGGGVSAGGFKGKASPCAGGVGFRIGVAPTLTAGQEAHTVYALQGNGIDCPDTANCNGAGWREGEMYTLNTRDRPAIAFQQNQRDEVRDMGEQAGALTAQPGVHNQNYVCYPDKARSLCARHDSSPCADRGQNVVAYKSTRFAEYMEGCGTLRANGGDVGGGTESIVVERV